MIFDKIKGLQESDTSATILNELKDVTVSDLLYTLHKEKSFTSDVDQHIKTLKNIDTAMSTFGSYLDQTTEHTVKNLLSILERAKNNINSDTKDFSGSIRLQDRKLSDNFDDDYISKLKSISKKEKRENDKFLTSVFDSLSHADNFSDFLDAFEKKYLQKRNNSKRLARNKAFRSSKLQSRPKKTFSKKNSITATLESRENVLDIMKDQFINLLKQLYPRKRQTSFDKILNDKKSLYAINEVFISLIDKKKNLDKISLKELFEQLIYNHTDYNTTALKEFFLRKKKDKVDIDLSNNLAVNGTHLLQSENEINSINEKLSDDGARGLLQMAFHDKDSKLLIGMLLLSDLEETVLKKIKNVAVYDKDGECDIESTLTEIKSFFGDSDGKYKTLLDKNTLNDGKKLVATATAKAQVYTDGTMSTDIVSSEIVGTTTSITQEPIAKEAVIENSIDENADVDLDPEDGVVSNTVGVQNSLEPTEIAKVVIDKKVAVADETIGEETSGDGVQETGGIAVKSDGNGDSLVEDAIVEPITTEDTTVVSTTVEEAASLSEAPEKTVHTVESLEKLYGVESVQKAKDYIDSHINTLVLEKIITPKKLDSNTDLSAALIEGFKKEELIGDFYATMCVFSNTVDEDIDDLSKENTTLLNSTLEKTFQKYVPDVNEIVHDYNNMTLSKDDFKFRYSPSVVERDGEIFFCMILHDNGLQSNSDKGRNLIRTTSKFTSVMGASGKVYNITETDDTLKLIGVKLTDDVRGDLPLSFVYDVSHIIKDLGGDKLKIDAKKTHTITMNGPIDPLNRKDFYEAYRNSSIDISQYEDAIFDYFKQAILENKEGGRYDFLNEAILDRLKNTIVDNCDFVEFCMQECLRISGRAYDSTSLQKSVDHFSKDPFGYFFSSDIIQEFLEEQFAAIDVSSYKYELQFTGAKHQSIIDNGTIGQETGTSQKEKSRIERSKNTLLGRVDIPSPDEVDSFSVFSGMNYSRELSEEFFGEKTTLTISTTDTNPQKRKVVCVGKNEEDGYFFNNAHNGGNSLEETLKKINETENLNRAAKAQLSNHLLLSPFVHIGEQWGEVTVPIKLMGGSESTEVTISVVEDLLTLTGYTSSGNPVELQSAKLSDLTTYFSSTNANKVEYFTKYLSQIAKGLHTRIVSHEVGSRSSTLRNFLKNPWNPGSSESYFAKGMKMKDIAMNTGKLFGYPFVAPVGAVRSVFNGKTYEYMQQIAHGTELKNVIHSYGLNPQAEQMNLLWYGTDLDESVNNPIEVTLDSGNSYIVETKKTKFANGIYIAEKGNPESRQKYSSRQEVILRTEFSDAQELYGKCNKEQMKRTFGEILTMDQTLVVQNPYTKEFWGVKKEKNGQLIYGKLAHQNIDKDDFSTDVLHLQKNIISFDMEFEQSSSATAEKIFFNQPRARNLSLMTAYQSVSPTTKKGARALLGNKVKERFRSDKNDDDDGSGEGGVTNTTLTQLLGIGGKGVDQAKETSGNSFF